MSVLENVVKVGKRHLVGFQLKYGVKNCNCYLATIVTMVSTVYIVLVNTHTHTYIDAHMCVDTLPGFIQHLANWLVSVLDCLCTTELC